MFRLLLILNCLLIFLSANVVCAEEAPVVGRKAAQKYFKAREPDAVTSPSTHIMMLHLGSFLSGDAWNWKVKEHQTDVGKTTGGLTYRIGEWTNSMDMNLRVDFIEYQVQDVKPFKMSILPLITFPDAGSSFPLYFGAGAGIGVFFRQNEDVSNLSFDYQLVAGARFMNLIEGTGFFVETGLKNHLHLLSLGQFNGVFLAGGAVFTF